MCFYLQKIPKTLVKSHSTSPNKTRFDLQSRAITPLLVEENRIAVKISTAGQLPLHVSKIENI